MLPSQHFRGCPACEELLLTDSHCSESHSAEERYVCASESRKVLSGDRGKGLGKEGGVETGMAAALTATGVLYSMWVHGRS